MCTIARQNVLYFDTRSVHFFQEEIGDPADSDRSDLDLHTSGSFCQPSLVLTSTFVLVLTCFNKVRRAPAGGTAA